jgi:hypothetical protein
MQEVLTISKKSVPNVLMTVFRHLCSSTTLYFVLAFRDAPTIPISNRYSILSIPILLMSQRHPLDVPTNFLLHHAHLAHAPGLIFPMYAVSVMDHIQLENATISLASRTVSNQQKVHSRKSMLLKMPSGTHQPCQHTLDPPEMTTQISICPISNTAHLISNTTIPSISVLLSLTPSTQKDLRSLVPLWLIPKQLM